ncbi:golgin subfamily A member 1 [Asbolus verrucosus]|uniref:Golgin subfamily A member 1 n=1 Tax=Asbolus verrucosus TaxID=1661398 RepID=A0A482VJF5_ASBVE|nr:golgin subfamily A member 1 [Asbolus verrucosus]
MFASLKNKIREETGSDLSKLTAKITSSTVQRIDSLRGRSHQGSSSSINSLVSSDGVREDGNIETEEFKKRLLKIESEYIKKLDQKELEWREIMNEKDKKLQNLEKEKDEALKQVSALRETVKNAEEFKQKLVEHQEDKEQMENFQTQELSKVKHLVLLREQELAEKTAALKEATTQLDKLRNEVSRLRRQEEQLSDLQDDLESLRHSTARDLAALATELAKSEEERRHLSDLVVVLRQRVGRLSRQAAEEGTERRRAVQEKEKLAEKVRQMEAELECNRLELNNKETKIKRLTTDVEELSVEVKALRSESEEEVTFLRTQLQNALTEVKVVRKNLENTESELDKTGDECSKLKLSVDSEHEANSSLRQMITKLEKELGEEKTNSLNVQKTLSRVTAEKNTALLRNAEISQQMELVKQEKRRQESEMTELLNKLMQVEDENKKHNESKSLEQQLRNNIAELEDQISEKNKNIKTLQLRLADMKKTLQQELRTPGNPNYHSDLLDNSAAILTPSQVSTKNFPSVVRRDEDDVNFKYLKHVVIKFLTSREYEAQHLTKAIATLLKFTADEEKLVNDTLEWKRSWFGSKPKLGSGQKARAIPHS